jgi:polyisoprenoid-binding protein YceI
MIRFRGLSAAILGGTLAALASAGSLFAQGVPNDWVIDTARSRLTVNVLPAGLLASALHTHHFEPQVWEGEISRDPERPGAVRISVKIAADSLRDRQPELSAKDVAKVEGQVRGAEILDAARFPKIVFEAGQVEGDSLPAERTGEFRGTLAGTLTLHGQSRPIRFPFQARAGADQLQASATAAFRQSDFGIKPYRAALGTIAVKDEITVEITLVAISRSRNASGRVLSGPDPVAQSFRIRKSEAPRRARASNPSIGNDSVGTAAAAAVTAPAVVERLGGTGAAQVAFEQVASCPVTSTAVLVLARLGLKNRANPRVPVRSAALLALKRTPEALGVTPTVLKKV